ncbi:PilN domain-containing protein [Pseudoteredinibacter isoporae]|uniref:MSHA biogenesis protein MshI n=1 Tax=Pseudoteredinibacter isoporae TaxID=570281 RepID=A0A7X0MXU7_9GAMM|nr:PilN domain-containing protein [Pseudoteredinibacter isoporae]MBB6522364.1 hypothetical protein [Pseudoteredinibacter isoporae]NHO87897.1 hypothetical protein [Pseudoteredinibacter isoporae]NIB23772.1 hypothetical protein [Pseudoteredinibacter isoporae]
MSEQLQLINLYPERLRPKKDPLDWGHLQLYVLLLVGVMTLLYLWQWGTLQQHYEEQAVARLNQQELDNNLAKLKASIPAGEKQRLEQRLQQEKERLALLRESQQLYLHNVGEERRGFYRALAAIANNSIPGVSIERILLEGKQRQLSLAGQAAKAEYVPEYLRSLQGESALQNTVFTELQMNRENSQVLFAMGSLVDGAKK